MPHSLFRLLGHGRFLVFVVFAFVSFAWLVDGWFCVCLFVFEIINALLEAEEMAKFAR